MAGGVWWGWQQQSGCQKANSRSSWLWACRSRRCEQSEIFSAFSSIHSVASSIDLLPVNCHNTAYNNREHHSPRHFAVEYLAYKQRASASIVEDVIFLPSFLSFLNSGIYWILDNSCYLSQRMHTPWEDTIRCFTMPLLFLFNLTWLYCDRTYRHLTWSSTFNSGHCFSQSVLQYACLWCLLGHHLGPVEFVDSASNSWVVLWRELIKITAKNLYLWEHSGRLASDSAECLTNAWWGRQAFAILFFKKQRVIAFSCRWHQMQFRVNSSFRWSNL